MTVKLTARIERNFNENTVNFTEKAKDVCLEMINLSADNRYKILDNLDIMVKTGNITVPEVMMIRDFCNNSDFNKLYRQGLKNIKEER